MNGYFKNNETVTRGTIPVVLKTEKLETTILGKVLVLYICLVRSGKDVYSALGKTAQEAQREAISLANKQERPPSYTIP